MKGSRSAAAALISIAILGVALVVLGTLQYRWIAAMVVPSGDVGRAMMERHMEDMSFARMPVPPMHMKIFQGPPHPAFTIIDLDRQYIARVFLPDLTRRYFDTPHGRDYELAVVAPESGEVLYRSDSGAMPFRADLVLPIFSVRALRREPNPLPMLQDPPPSRPLWQLLVRHHQGS